MPMDLEVRREARARKISRLCHFTPSRNFLHIATDQAILPASELRETVRRIYNPTDQERFDRHPDRTSCSVEYPNAWYLRRAAAKFAPFPDWVVLLLPPHYLWPGDTKFCHRNAAGGGGQYVREGVEAFRGMFAEEVVGSRDRTYRRRPERLDCCPTDEQAEVLIKGSIPLTDVQGVCVESEGQGRTEVVRLRHLGVEVAGLRWIIAPAMFDASALSRDLKRGRRPDEKEWDPPRPGRRRS